jgi:putative membrane protein
MMPYYGYNYFSFGLIGGVLSFVFWIVIIVLIIRLIRGSRHHDLRHGWKDMIGDKSALDILKERYAKGEINKAEFEEKKKDLAM